MTAIPKQIVIDKSAFVGIKLSALGEFAEQHFLILPSVLHDECVTNEGKAARLLDRYEQVILAGGFFCPSIRSIAEAEALSLQPYGQLADFEGSESWRRALRNGLGLCVPPDAESTCKEHLGVAQRTLAQNRMVVDAICGKRFAGICSELKRANVSTAHRLRTWSCEVDRLNLAERCAGVIELFGGHVEPRLLSDEWVTWQHIKVCTLMALELRFIEESRSSTKVEHDLQDAEYVSLLSRADAIISKDKKMVEPLARAAFPEKDVFSSLEEVPESYRCNWAGRG